MREIKLAVGALAEGVEWAFIAFEESGRLGSACFVHRERAAMGLSASVWAFAAHGCLVFVLRFGGDGENRQVCGKIKRYDRVFG